MQPQPLVGEGTAQWLASLAAKAPPGCIVELGVYQGGSARFLAEVARAQGRTLYLYDTFAGIPVKDEVDNHQIGDFGDTSLEAVAAAIPDAVIVQGVFPESLVPMEPIAFCHVDADQYRSVKAACEHLGPRMVPGGTMVFDDYDRLLGATMAVDEAFGDRVDKSGERAAVRF